MSNRQYWLMKSEPDAFSIDDLEEVGTEPWDGIRNYEARNFMRDEMNIGDGVLFYHSQVRPPVTESEWKKIHEMAGVEVRL